MKIELAYLRRVEGRKKVNILTKSASVPIIIVETARSVLSRRFPRTSPKISIKDRGSPTQPTVHRSVLRVPPKNGESNFNFCNILRRRFVCKDHRQQALLRRHHEFRTAVDCGRRLPRGIPNLPFREAYKCWHGL